MGNAIQSLSNEPGPGLQSAGPCMTIQPQEQNKMPVWLSIRNPKATLSDKICDFKLYDSEEKHTDDCFDIYAKGLLSPSNITKNSDGTYSCASQKTLSQFNSIYVTLHDRNTGKRVDRIWIRSKKDYLHRTLASLSLEIREASRRKYYPKYLYLLCATGSIVGRKVSDFTLYSKQNIPDMGFDLIRLDQLEIPAVYKQKDGTYRCTDESLVFDNENGIRFREVEKKSPWHRPCDLPTPELCRTFKNRFVSWDGKDIYIVSFDEYDRIFRKPTDVGGVVRNNKDEAMIAWACLPVPPSENWGKINA